MVPQQEGGFSPTEQLACIYKGAGDRDSALVLCRPCGKCFSQREKTLVVNLDRSGAFDCKKFSLAKETLDAAGSPVMIAGWYNTVLTGHLVSADLQGAHNTIIPTMDSLQGKSCHRLSGV